MGLIMAENVAAGGLLNEDLDTNFLVVSKSAVLLPIPKARVQRKSAACVKATMPCDAVEQDRLVLEHLPRVRYVARQIQRRLWRRTELDELILAGLRGLIDASRKYNPDKDVQFHSYAQFRIRGSILDSLRSLDWAPRDLRRDGRATEVATQALVVRQGRQPAETEVAIEMGVSLGDYQRLLGQLKGLETEAINSERSEDPSEEELPFVLGKRTDDPFDQCLEGEVRILLFSAIGKLSKREQLVVRLYYYEERTMKEISVILGVVESRVSQLHGKAIEHLRFRLSDLSGPPRARRYIN